MRDQDSQSTGYTASSREQRTNKTTTGVFQTGEISYKLKLSDTAAAAAVGTLLARRAAAGHKVPAAADLPSLGAASPSAQDPAASPASPSAAPSPVAAAPSPSTAVVLPSVAVPLPTSSGASASFPRRTLPEVDRCRGSDYKGGEESGVSRAKAMKTKKQKRTCGAELTCQRPASHGRVPTWQHSAFGLRTC